MKFATINPENISAVDAQTAIAVEAEVENTQFPMSRAEAARRLGFSSSNRQTPNQHFRRWLDPKMPLATEEDFIEFYLRVNASKKPFPGLTYYEFDVLKDQARSSLESQGNDHPTHRQILDALEPTMNKLGISQKGAKSLCLRLDSNP